MTLLVQATELKTNMENSHDRLPEGFVKEQLKNNPQDFPLKLVSGWESLAKFFMAMEIFKVANDLLAKKEVAAHEADTKKGEAETKKGEAATKKVEAETKAQEAATADATKETEAIQAAYAAEEALKKAAKKAQEAAEAAEAAKKAATKADEAEKVFTQNDAEAARKMFLSLSS